MLSYIYVKHFLCCHHLHCYLAIDDVELLNFKFLKLKMFCLKKSFQLTPFMGFLPRCKVQFSFLFQVNKVFFSKLPAKTGFLLLLLRLCIYILRFR